MGDHCRAYIRLEVFRYLAFVCQPTRTVVAALQLSSPAWRLAARDRWIGWDEPTRQRNLQRVVNNSRFVVLPWVRVQNLASRLLALLARRLAADWQARFAVEPLLLETLVDGSRFAGTCYRAANWIELGDTAGRGGWIAPMPAMARGTEAGAGVSSGGGRSAPVGGGLSGGRCGGLGAGAG